MNRAIVGGVGGAGNDPGGLDAPVQGLGGEQTVLNAPVEQGPRYGALSAQQPSGLGSSDIGDRDDGGVANCGVCEPLT